MADPPGAATPCGGARHSVWWPENRAIRRPMSIALRREVWSSRAANTWRIGHGEGHADRGDEHGTSGRGRVPRLVRHGAPARAPARAGLPRLPALDRRPG